LLQTREKQIFSSWPDDESAFIYTVLRQHSITTRNMRKRRQSCTH